MEKTSKDLLKFEHTDPSSAVESALLVCGKRSSSDQKKPNSDGKPPTTADVPQSDVLSKVKGFLGVISEANENLETKAKDNPEDYDIEVLREGESEYIEMDLMLGVADLQTPEAVAAAEAAINGRQPLINLPAESSSTDSEDSSSEEEDDEDEDSSESEEEDDEDEDSSESEDEDGKSKRGKLKNQKDDSGRNQKSKKRPKIVELP